jgi:hypothetical protein
MHLTLLTAAMGTVFLAVLLGAWLSSLYLLREEPPKGMIVGLIHGTLGTATVALVLFALQGPRTHQTPHGPHTGGAGSFGWTAFAVLAATLVGGVTILFNHLRGRPIMPLLIAMHACAGVAGAVILAAYYSTPASYGR